MEEKNLEEISLASLSLIKNNNDVKHFLKVQEFESVKDFLDADVYELLESNKRYSYNGVKDKIRGVYDLLNYKFLNKGMPITVKLNSPLNFDFKHDVYYFSDITLERLGFSTTEVYLIEKYIKAIYKKQNDNTLINILTNFLSYLKQSKKTSISLTLIEKIELYVKAYQEKKELYRNFNDTNLKELRSNIDTLYERRKSLSSKIDKYSSIKRGRK